jgi:hypothetical protein
MKSRGYKAYWWAIGVGGRGTRSRLWNLLKGEQD